MASVMAMIACRYGTRFVFAVVALLALGSASAAQCALPEEGIDVAVGIREAPPFIIDDPIRGNRGFALELWRSIEEELQDAGQIGATQLIECSLADQIAALSAGYLDLVISPLTITAERMQEFDFTQQYLNSGITVAHPSHDIIDFGVAFRILSDTLTQPGVPRAIIVFLALNILLAFLISIMFRYHVHFQDIKNEPRLVRWIRAALEAIVRTSGLHSLGEFRSTLTRLLDTFMVTTGTILSATIFGVLTAALIGSIGSVRDISLAELGDLRVATLENSTSQHFLETLGEQVAIGPSVLEQTGNENSLRIRRRVRSTDRGEARFTPVDQALAPFECKTIAQAKDHDRCITARSWSDAVAYLADGEVDAVVGDWVQLSYLSRLGGRFASVQVQSSAFRSEPYGWGVSSERPELRAAIDRALLARMRHPQWRFLVQDYLGSGSIGAN